MTIKFDELFFSSCNTTDVINKVLLFTELESSFPVSIFGFILPFEAALNFMLKSDDFLLNLVEDVTLVILLFTVAV